MRPPNLSPTSAPVALLERDAELELVNQVLGGVPGGEGALLLFEGPPGIGKTRLLGAARDRAEALGFEVLRARGGEMERDFSNGVVRQLFEPRLARATATERESLLGGAAALAAPAIQLAGGSEAVTARQDSQFATLHGLFWLTANLAEQGPVLLLVDDLHWCDSPSLRFLSYLARRLEGMPVLVAASSRDWEPGADASLLPELGGDPRATVIRPAVLSSEAVAQLLATRLDADPAPEFLDSVHASCGGNPLLLGELVHALAAEGFEPTAAAAPRVRELGPETLSRYVLRRLRRLGGAAETLARAVAVLGEAADLATAADLAVLELDEAGEVAATLARADILSSRGALSFVHPVLRAAVYGELGDAERELAHARAADLLIDRGAAPQHVAAHLLHVPAQARPSVVTTLREAARRAKAEGAAEVACAYLARALAEPPEEADLADVLLELGTAELSEGLPDAVAHLREAHGRLSDERAIEAVVPLANALYARGLIHDGAELLRATIERLGPEDTAHAERLEAQLITWARFDERLYPGARERLASSAEKASEDTVGGRYLLALAASELARAGESPEDAHALARRALAGEPSGSYESWQLHLVAIAVLITLDELDTAVSRFDEWLALARRQGSLFAFSHASSFRALAMLRRGDLREAEADARAAYHAIPLVRWHSVTILAETLTERGQVDEALTAIEGIRRRDDEEEPPTYQMARWLAARASVRLLSGETERGVADLLDAGERLKAIGVLNPNYAAWRSQAGLALLGLGRIDESRALIGEELELAQRWRAPRALGGALRAAGLAAPDDEAGHELLRKSVGVLEGSPARLEKAKSLTELGAALRRANARSEAREYLREGLELAELCGAAPLAERAHTELLATGARPRRVMRTGVDSLTPSEHRVARMAANGQTNREIAQALFVTPKTVEMHLSHAYRKLDIQSRSQLEQALRT